MKIHLETVHVEKQFFCDLCGAVFKAKLQLTGHKKSVHEGEREFTKFDKTKKGKKANKCQICQIAYRYRKQLINHMSTVHEEKNPYQCQICESNFTAPENLKYHMDALHGQGVAR